MKIDAKLNLVVPVETDKGLIYVHSTPISYAVFERYFVVISKAFAAIYSEGLSTIAGPRIAALMLKKIATDLGEWEGETGVERGLVAEIRRLTNVVIPAESGGGWTTLPLQLIIDRKELLNEGDLAEVENAIVFFTIICSMQKRSMQKTILDGAASLWGAQIVSLNSTEFAASLTTSTMVENSGGTTVASSLPS